MKFSFVQGSILFMFVFLLSGCLYPESELEQNQVAHEEQLKTVQTAVEQYKEDNQGRVPIRTKPNDTPIFEKYLIDFTELKESNTLAETPGNAYENGGNYQYTLITPEDNPRVRLIDLRMTESIRMVNIRLDAYRSENIYPPFGEKIGDDLYTLDYEALGLDSRPTVVSPYSKESLPIIMDTNGTLYVDYRIDLNQALNEYDHNYEEGDDIRYLLANHTPFVPAYSVPYTIENGEPAFMTSN